MNSKEAPDSSDSMGNGRSQDPRVIAAYEEMARGFEDRDPRDQRTYMISKLNTDYVLMETVDIENRTILNVGCSFPVDELYFARKFARWTAVDASHSSLAASRTIVDRELHPELAGKISFEHADACDLPFEDSTFDVTVSMSTFDHLPSAAARQEAVTEMARTTRPGGFVIVTVANRWCLPYALGIRKMSREKTLHYGYAYLFSPLEIRAIGRRAGLDPIHFASSISPPTVWLPGYPIAVRWSARAVFGLMRLWGYFGRRVGYAFRKPQEDSST